MTRRERKQPESRRRTGCWTCKEKHVQCTEERPRCSRCERLDLECMRGIKLLWKEDAVQRGIHFGREGAWSRRSSKIKKPFSPDIDHNFQAVPIKQYTGRWIFVNTTTWDFGDGGEQLKDGDCESHSTRLGNAEAGREVDSLSLRGALGHPLSSYSHIESSLLDYFVRAIGPNCSLSPFYNPYLSLVTPIALSHVPLKNTLLAISANQLQLLGDKRFVKNAYIYKQRALTGLQNEINEKKPSFGAVATVLMLCFHDIADGCTLSWMTHLRGGLKLMEFLTFKCTESHLLKQFFIMYFVAHEIMSRTAGDDASAVEPEHQVSWLEGDNLEEIDVLMGCSRGLMTLISRISALAQEKIKIMKERALSSREASYFATARDALEKSLYTTRQVLPQFAAGQTEILDIAETKRLSALLYLRERLGYQSTSCSVRSFEKPYPLNGSIYANNPMVVSGGIETSSAACKSRLIAAIIALISTLPDSATLLWPLFVIGNIGSDGEETRRFVLERLERIQKTRNLGSVRRARMVVEHAYRAKDLDYPRGKVWGTEGSAAISLA